MDISTIRVLSAGWLGQTEPSLRQNLLAKGNIRTFIDGALIFGFEQHQSCLWGVVSGSVRLFVALADQEPKLAHCAGPGFWFGEGPVITGRNRALQAMAAGEVRLCAIDQSAIVRLAATEVEVWQAVATLSAMNQITAIGAAEDLMMRDPGKRLIATLLRLAGHRHAYQGTAPMQTVPVTQTELAEAANLSRSSATVILRDLVRQEMIRTDYSKITVLDPLLLAGLLVEA